MTKKINPMKIAVLGMTESDVDEANQEPRKASSKPKKLASKKSQLAPSRENKRHIGGFFDPLVAKQLKILAAEEDCSIQSLLQEAMNDLFDKYGKSSVA